MSIENIVKSPVSKAHSNHGFFGRFGRLFASAILTVGLSGCPVNDSNGNGNGNGVPVCDTNPIVELAEDYNLPRSIVDGVSVLGDDCDVSSEENNLVSNLLPGILDRSNETIALSYVNRFVEDDGKFDGAENITMSRFFDGRYDREGLQVHPGYFSLVDQGHVQIPNAYFMPIFEMPFRFDPFPAGNAGNKGLPIVDDNPLVSHYNVFNIGRTSMGDGPDQRYSWFELFGDNISPSPNICVTDYNYASLQMVFANRRNPFSIEVLEIVNPFPVPARVTEIGFLVNYPDIRNASVRLEPIGWPSSLGHTGLHASMSHVDDEDIESSGLQVGDIIPVEGRVGRVDPNFPEWRLIFSYRSDDGFYREGDADKDSRFKAIDIFHPHFYEPYMRGRVWPVYYESVALDGVPEIELLGVHNKVCNFIVDDNVYWGRHPDVAPMRLYYPSGTMKR